MTTEERKVEQKRWEISTTKEIDKKSMNIRGNSTMRGTDQ